MNSHISFGDYKNTADRPAEFFPVEGDWEAIPTTNESYGYHKYDNSHKPVSHFIRLIANAASRGGNLLMNIGPMGNGMFDPKDTEILNGIGNWMDINSESIHGTVASPLPLQYWGVTTMKENKLFLHVFNWPADKNLIVGGLKSNIEKAWLLSDPLKRELTFNRLNPLDLRIKLTGNAPDSINTVIVLETKEKTETDPVRLLADKQIINRLLAFDSELKGEGFRFGDGKTNRYFVEGWTRKEQEISWKVRLNNSATYRLSLIYAGSAESEGSFNICIDNKILKEYNVTNKQKTSVVYKLNLGTITLNEGVHTLSLKPKEIMKTELMKILELQLIPLK